jgi:hypothetical protein
MKSKSLANDIPCLSLLRGISQTVERIESELLDENYGEAEMLAFHVKLDAMALEDLIHRIPEPKWFYEI